MGMDMANHIAVARGLVQEEHFHHMHTTMRKNYGDYAKTPIPLDAMLSALMKDKKNTSTMLELIFPMGKDAEIQRVQVPPDDTFRSQCISFLAGLSK